MYHALEVTGIVGNRVTYEYDYRYRQSTRIPVEASRHKRSHNHIIHTIFSQLYQCLNNTATMKAASFPPLRLPPPGHRHPTQSSLCNSTTASENEMSLHHTLRSRRWLSRSSYRQSSHSPPQESSSRAISRRSHIVAVLDEALAISVAFLEDPRITD